MLYFYVSEVVKLTVYENGFKQLFMYVFCFRQHLSLFKLIFLRNLYLHAFKLIFFYKMSLKTLLEENGIQQKLLAQSLQVSETPVSSWWHGRSKPRIKKMEVISILLKVTPKKLTACL